MRFYAKSDKGIVFTDDYSKDEIENGLHIKHIKEDFKGLYKGDMCITVYDENDKLIRKILLCR